MYGSWINAWDLLYCQSCWLPKQNSVNEFCDWRHIFFSVKAEGQTLSNVILHNVNQRCKSSPDWKSPIPNKITLKKKTKKTKLFILLQVAKQETRFLRQIIPQQSKEYIHTSPKAHPAMWAYIENESSKSPNRVWVMNCINVMHL